MKKFLSIVLCFTMAMFAISGCTKNEDSETTEETAAESTITSVVSLSPACTEVIFALGASDKLTGVTSYDDYPEDVFAIQQVGDTMAPDTELIASLTPDVVFATSYLSEETQTALDALNINLVIVDEAPDMDGVLANIQLIADALEMTAAGEELVASMSADIAAATATEMSDVSVYYVVGYGEYGDYTAGAGTFVDGIITAGGAVNAGAAADGWYISQEALIEADPDIILVPNWAVDDFCAMEPYASLTAVATGNVIAVDSNIFDRQGPRNVQAIETVAQAVADYEAAEQAAA